MLHATHANTKKRQDPQGGTISLSSSLLPTQSIATPLSTAKCHASHQIPGSLGPPIRPPIPTTKNQKSLLMDPPHPPKPSQPARGAGFPYWHPTNSEVFLFHTCLLLYLHPPSRSVPSPVLRFLRKEVTELKLRPTDTKYHVSGCLLASLLGQGCSRPPCLMNYLTRCRHSSCHEVYGDSTAWWDFKTSPKEWSLFEDEATGSNLSHG